MVTYEYSHIIAFFVRNNLADSLLPTCSQFKSFLSSAHGPMVKAGQAPSPERLVETIAKLVKDIKPTSYSCVKISCIKGDEFAAWDAYFSDILDDPEKAKPLRRAKAAGLANWLITGPTTRQASSSGSSHLTHFMPIDPTVQDAVQSEGRASLEQMVAIATDYFNGNDTITDDGIHQDAASSDGHGRTRSDREQRMAGMWLSNDDEPEEVTAGGESSQGGPTWTNEPASGSVLTRAEMPPIPPPDIPQYPVLPVLTPAGPQPRERTATTALRHDEVPHFFHDAVGHLGQYGQTVRKRLHKYIQDLKLNERKLAQRELDLIKREQAVAETVAQAVAKAIAEREQALAARESAVAGRESAVAERGEVLDTSITKAKQHFAERGRVLDQNTHDLKARAQDLEEREEDLRGREQKFDKATFALKQQAASNDQDYTWWEEAHERQVQEQEEKEARLRKDLDNLRRAKSNLEVRESQAAKHERENKKEQQRLQGEAADLKEKRDELKHDVTEGKYDTDFLRQEQKRIRDEFERKLKSARALDKIAPIFIDWIKMTQAWVTVTELRMHSHAKKAGIEWVYRPWDPPSLVEIEQAAEDLGEIVAQYAAGENGHE